MFWDKYVKKWSMEKESKKGIEKGDAVNEVCGRGGGQRRGGGFASHLCKELYTSI